MNRQAKNWLFTTLIIVLLVFLLFAVSWKKEDVNEGKESRQEGSQTAENLQSYMDEPDNA